MLQNSFYAISGTFYTLLNNTDLYQSYFILSYVFLGHNDSVEWGLTVKFEQILYDPDETITKTPYHHLVFVIILATYPWDFVALLIAD